MLGRGGFGAVFMATKSFERVDYAVKKVVLCEGGNVNNRTLHVLREVRVFAKFDQVNIVRFYSVREMGWLDRRHGWSLFPCRIWEKSCVAYTVL